MSVQDRVRLLRNQFSRIIKISPFVILDAFAVSASLFLQPSNLSLQQHNGLHDYTNTYKNNQ